MHVFNEYSEIYIVNYVNYTLSVYGCLGDCVFVFAKYSTIKKENTPAARYCARGNVRTVRSVCKH